ncbi:hypothetical protein BKA70DRAFT_1232007 [Coprinopsis sp. MPI-PUGE-AT-0042]|nr:hypothetical protein BKA70DRAFT_1232007 [Coprinopsis sp. MPI-PUGE-AT-0042]
MAAYKPAATTNHGIVAVQKRIGAHHDALKRPQYDEILSSVTLLNKAKGPEFQRIWVEGCGYHPASASHQTAPVRVTAPPRANLGAMLLNTSVTQVSPPSRLTFLAPWPTLMVECPGTLSGLPALGFWDTALGICPSVPAVINIYQIASN